MLPRLPELFVKAPRGPVPSSSLERNGEPSVENGSMSGTVELMAAPKIKGMK